MRILKIKDWNRKTTSDKILLAKAFNNTKNPKYDGYQRGLASIVYNFLIKKLLPALLKWEYFKQRISWRIPQTNY